MKHDKLFYADFCKSEFCLQMRFGELSRAFGTA